MTYGDPSWEPWVLPEALARPLIEQAFGAGITFFDTADYYSRGVSEEILGRVLRELGPRDRYVISTKVFFPTGDGDNQRGLSRKHIVHAVDASLRRLGMDYVDLYHLHRWDPETPIEETLAALDDLVRAGKVLYLGASSMRAWQFAKALYTADRLRAPRFISMQNHYNLTYREQENEMIGLCVAEGIGVLPYSPLARGFLTGNHAAGKETLRAKTDRLALGRYYQDNDFQIFERLQAVANARATSPARVALAWLLGRSGVSSVVVGASRPEHLTDAIAALDIQLTKEENTLLEELYLPHRISEYT